MLSRSKMAEPPLFLILAKLGRPSITLDDRNIFDNRIEGDHLGPLGFTSSAEERRSFYDLKFRYYVAKIKAVTEEGNPALLQVPQNGFDVPEISEDLATTLDEWFADEVKAYLLRRLHAPVSVVHETWYNNLPAFDSWASAVTDLAARCTTPELSRMLGTRFPICMEEETRLSEAARKLSAELGNILSVPVPLDAGLLALRTEHLRQALSSITASVAAKIAEGRSSFEDILNVIVRGIKEEYGVKICDYLEVTVSDEYPRLRLLVSSWGNGDHGTIRLAEAAYAKAGGITGSVFLLAPGSGFRWVGTNLLGEDSRQSVRHKVLFESVYGRVSAFLAFPVFDGNLLAGALRLIEPEGTSTGNQGQGMPGTWPFEMRVELCHLADWIGSLIPLLKHAFPGGSHDSPLAEVSRFRPGWLDLLPIRYLSSVLTECVRVASMRSEHRTVACTIAIGTPDACSALKERTRPYPAVQKDRSGGLIEHATDLFGRVVPGAGVFVCEIPQGSDTDVLPLSYTMILATGVLSTEAAASKYENIRDLSFVDVDGGRRVISFYHWGRWSGDYFINEKTGRWQLRVREILIRRLLEHGPGFRPQLISNLVCRYLIPYSYEGHGGLVLLADSMPRSVVAEDGFDVKLPLDDMDSTVFSTIVSVDGGTWIDAEGMVRQAGVLYSSGAGDEARPEGGARHKAAHTVAEGCTDGLIFAISTNRVITVFARGHVLFRF